jgi:hypothetical protein
MNRPAPFLILLAACLAACDSAPHENPLDPRSDRPVTAGAVAGQVTGVYPPFPRRPGVRVRLLPIDGGVERVTTTDSRGEYSLEDIPRGRYIVRVGGEGLRTDSVEVIVETATLTQADFQLDEVPRVLDQAAQTARVDRQFPNSPLYTFTVKAAVTDPDRPTDVSEVAVVSSALGLRLLLNRDSTGAYSATYEEDVLPEGRIQSLLGKPLQIEVTDVFGNVGEGPAFSVARVIESAPQALRPSGLTVVSTPQPLLEWSEILLPFPFTIEVEVFLIDGAGIPNQVVSATGLDPFVTSYVVPEPLAPGDYFWVLRVRDLEGNTSRSRQAGFRISEPT